MDDHKIEKKYSSAVKMLTLWSPWWLDYLSKTKRYYIPGSSQEFQGTSRMVLFAGEEFMLNKTPLEIAISLEYGLQQAVREVDRRARVTLLTNTNLDSEIVALAHSMEIFSDMEEKFNSISDSSWEGLVATNIHKDYIDFYDAKNRPYVPANAITCHDFNFEPGLSAESYIKLLSKLDRDQEQEWINAQDSKLKRGDDYEDVENDDKNSEKKSGKSDNRSKKGTSGNNQDRDFNYEDDNYTPRSNNEDDENSTAQDSSNNRDNNNQSVDEESNSQNSTQDNAPSEKEEKSSISPDETNSNEESDNQEEEYKDNENSSNVQSHNNKEAPVNKDSQNRDDNENMELDSEIDPEKSNSDTSDDDSDEYDSNNSNTEDKYEKDIEKDQGNTNYSPETGGYGADGISMDDNQFGQEKNFDDIEDKDDFDDLLSPTEDSSSSQSGEERYVPLSRRVDYQARKQDTVSASLPEKPDEAQGLTNSEVEEATNSLAEDIMEYEKNPQIPTLHVSGGSFTSWADIKTHKSKQSWKNLLPRILTSVSGKAAASGLGDLSFSKRNPNQTDDMPLMMGFITYPPNVTILIDSSPSMQMHSEKTMSEFTALVGKFFARYGEPITVIVSDSGIKDAFSAVSINAKTKRAVKKTYHGSSANFGDTVEQILKKGASFRGRNFPKPDILVILTDCEFLWPMMDKSKLPGKYADVIVVSTNEYDSIKDILPKWVREGKNFVYAI